MLWLMQRADARRVVRAQVRDIEYFRAIVQHPNAVVGQAADDRPARAGGEPAGRQPGLTGEGVAETGGGALFQLIFIQDRHGLRGIGRTAFDLAAGDDDAGGCKGAQVTGWGSAKRPRFGRTRNWRC